MGLILSMQECMAPCDKVKEASDLCEEYLAVKITLADMFHFLIPVREFLTYLVDDEDKEEKEEDCKKSDP